VSPPSRGKKKGDFARWGEKSVGCYLTKALNGLRKKRCYGEAHRGKWGKKEKSQRPERKKDIRARRRNQRGVWGGGVPTNVLEQKKELATQLDTNCVNCGREEKGKSFSTGDQDRMHPRWTEGEVSIFILRKGKKGNRPRECRHPLLEKWP